MHKQRLQRSEVTGAERFDGRGGAEKMFRCKTRTRSSVEYFWLPERKGLCSEGGWGGGTKMMTEIKEIRGGCNKKYVKRENDGGVLQSDVKWLGFLRLNPLLRWSSTCLGGGFAAVRPPLTRPGCCISSSAPPCPDSSSSVAS